VVCRAYSEAALGAWNDVEQTSDIRKNISTIFSTRYLELFKNHFHFLANESGNIKKLFGLHKNETKSSDAKNETAFAFSSLTAENGTGFNNPGSTLNI